MSDQGQTPNPDQDNPLEDWLSVWEIDISSLTMLTLFEWNRAARRNDMDTLINIMASVIRNWPYLPLDPAKPEDYGYLTPVEFVSAARAITEAIDRNVKGSLGPPKDGPERS